MIHLVCPKCNEMNVGSAIYCLTCGESLRGAKVVEASDKTYIESKINDISAETPKEVYIVFIMGVIFVLLPGSILVSAKNVTLVSQLFCSLPILFGVGLLVAGIDMVRHPGKYSNKKTSAGIEVPQAQVKCSICNRTNADYLRDLKRKDPNVYIISNKFIGICPVCKKAFCVEHAAYDGEIDHEVCPIHKEKLIVA